MKCLNSLHDVLSSTSKLGRSSLYVMSKWRQTSEASTEGHSGSLTHILDSCAATAIPSTMCIWPLKNASDDLAECRVWLLRRQNLLVLAALELRRLLMFPAKEWHNRQQNLILMSGFCCFKWGRRPHPQTTCLWRRGGSASHCHCRAGSFKTINLYTSLLEVEITIT